MQNSRNSSASGSNKRTALITLGLIGLMFVGLIGLWWTAAMKTPSVMIPNPVMPNPNAFDFYISAGNAIVNDKQIANASGTKPLLVLTLAQQEALVQQNVGAINTQRQGFAYPYLNPPARSIFTLLPYYSKFRSMARLLSLQGKVRAEQGNWSGAAESDLDAMQMGGEIPHGSILIGQSAGVACQAIGRRPMWNTVEHLNAALSRAAAQRLESIMGRHLSFADTLQEEKWYGQACRLEIFGDTKKRNDMMNPANGNQTSGASTAQSLTMLLYLAYSKGRIMNNYTTYMDRSIALARQPYCLHLPTPPAPADPINSLMSIDYSAAKLKWVDNETQNGLLLITLMLHAFQLEHGHYPASLTELAPAYLKSLPDDPFAAQGTFKYLAQGKSYVLYSVGPDGKDDGGKPIDNPKQAANNPYARYYVNPDSLGDVVAGQNVY